MHDFNDNAADIFAWAKLTVPRTKDRLAMAERYALRALAITTVRREDALVLAAAEHLIKRYLKLSWSSKRFAEIFSALEFLRSRGEMASVEAAEIFVITRRAARARSQDLHLGWFRSRGFADATLFDLRVARELERRGKARWIQDLSDLSSYFRISASPTIATHVSSNLGYPDDAFGAAVKEMKAPFLTLWHRLRGAVERYDEYGRFTLIPERAIVFGRLLPRVGGPRSALNWKDAALIAGPSHHRYDEALKDEH